MNPREYEALFAVEDRHWWFVELWREIERALPEAGGGVWLDAGCGTGGALAGVRWSGMAVGLDASPRAVLLARRRGLARLVIGSADALPFRDGAFDAITSIDVLCHRDVAKPRALSEAARCLKTGGLLILQVPAFDSLRAEHDDAVWTDRRFRRLEVAAILRNAGLAPRRPSYRNSFLFPAVAARRLFSRRRARATDDARSDVRPASGLANAAFGAVLRSEAVLRRAGIRFPFGLSVFCVARKGR